MPLPKRGISPVSQAVPLPKRGINMILPVRRVSVKFKYVCYPISWLSLCFVSMLIDMFQCSLSLVVVPSECSIARVDDPVSVDFQLPIAINPCHKYLCRSNRQISVYFQVVRSRSGVSPLVLFLVFVDVNAHNCGSHAGFRYCPLCNFHFPLCNASYSKT